ncbi:type II secretion system F family protein [Inconstantimicrobium mannanitabidum]|uniref:Type II secretion system protein F n=1 Tax=Inconstantimicrobium mannanitabidum TaxID=1604901 RepID=A0ACB5R6J2_9CLOT|nr:type II secretion system F family protein [Clostridium sp. TW13]GKX64838.1 type II secretion system protein F [Clostridium sp. TW13]
MSKFKYRAMTSEGNKIEGIYEGQSQNDVLSMISSNGYYPLMIEEIKENGNIQFKINKKVKTKHIAIFCRQFYTMLNAGLPLTNCLNVLANQVEHPRLREAVGEIEEEVKKGNSLSSSMKKYKDVFPDLLVNLVEAGEVSGNLDTILLRMANHYEKENKVNNKVKGAMIYPIVLSVVAISVLIFILTYVMPTFMNLFNQTGTKLPWNTRFLMWLSNALSNHFILCAVVVLAAVLGIKYYCKTDNGTLFMSKLKLKLPIIKKLNQKIIVSRFTRTLSTLLASGITLVQALQIVSTVVGNKIAENSLLNIKEKVVRGEGLYSSIKAESIFPEMLSSMVKIGEETGSLDDILNKTADFYDEEVETTIQSTVALLEPILIVVMGLVIGFIILSIMLPMYDSYTQI